jgi:hypothetical protein
MSRVTLGCAFATLKLLNAVSRLISLIPSGSTAGNADISSYLRVPTTFLSVCLLIAAFPSTSADEFSAVELQRTSTDIRPHHQLCPSASSSISITSMAANKFSAVQPRRTSRSTVCLVLLSLRRPLSSSSQQFNFRERRTQDHRSPCVPGLGCARSPWMKIDAFNRRERGILCQQSSVKDFVGSLSLSWFRFSFADASKLPRLLSIWYVDEFSTVELQRTSTDIRPHHQLCPSASSSIWITSMAANKFSAVQPRRT